MIGTECLHSDPKKRPVVSHINDRLDKLASIVETRINNSSVEQQVSFLKEQYCQEKIAKISFEYLGKDIKERDETEELVEYVGTHKEDRWQEGREEVRGDQWTLWGAPDTNQSIIPQGASFSSSNSGLLYKLNNLEIFNAKARRNYRRYGGLTLEHARSLRLYTRGELKPLLKNKNIIGKGDFGKVYAGLLGGETVIVKKLISGSVPEDGGLFPNEVLIQSQVIHKNIVRLLGCCLEADTPMLVYEYLSKGSLQDILFFDRVPLNLDLRLSIAAESSNGLAYMHSRAHCKILHGNFKPSNILFGDNYAPKISDFGISRMAAQHNGIIDGEMVYMDPAYLQTGLLTEKSDVYSFGVTMLEIITRRKATHSDNNSLVTNFLRNHKIGRKSTELFDGEIAVAENLELLDNLAEIAVACLNHDPDERPMMEDVAERLSMLNQSRREAAS